MFVVEPSSLRPVPRALDSHFPPLFRQKRGAKQDSTCKAKFSAAAQRKRRPLKFKQPRGGGTGGQRRSAGLAWANTATSATSQLRNPATSTSPARPERPPLAPRPYLCQHLPAGELRVFNPSSRCSAGPSLPGSPAPPHPAPPQGPPPPRQEGGGTSVTPATPGRHRASSPTPSQRNLPLWCACVHVRVCMGRGGGCMWGWRRLGHHCPPLPVGTSGAASRPGW